MFTVTWIEQGQLFTVSSPSLKQAGRVFYRLRVQCKLAARMWYTSKGATVKVF